MLDEHADLLLGPRANDRRLRIMVTRPSQAADDRALMHELLRQGMDCIRNNYAHDDAATWLRMIENLRQAERALERSCKVEMDLAGPKLRTAFLAPGPQVVKIRSTRDVYGRVVPPGRMWISSGTGVQFLLPTDAASLAMPEKWMAGLRSSCCGVMIVRGHLVVESGFEHLAEVQEEMLWICEATHVPVIWGTQVLETLTKYGRPSRAKITDAATGDRAECVMLYKGPHIVEAVVTLDDILKRMQAHQAKKQSMLKKLRLSDAFPAGSVKGSPNPV